MLVTLFTPTTPTATSSSPGVKSQASPSKKKSPSSSTTAPLTALTLSSPLASLGTLPKRYCLMSPSVPVAIKKACKWSGAAAGMGEDDKDKLLSKSLADSKYAFMPIGVETLG